MKDDSVYLGHIYERTSRILDITSDMTLEEFKDNFLVQDSVIRSLEIIGEAANKLSDDFCSKHSEIPVREMKGLRNVLIHAYSYVDLVRIWNVVRQDVPPLHETVIRISESYGFEI